MKKTYNAPYMKLTKVQPFMMISTSLEKNEMGMKSSQLTKEDYGWWDEDED